MKTPPPIPDEDVRIATLRQYDVLDTAFESAYDDLTELASTICEVPISLVSLVDTDRQWFKSRRGVDACETSRDASFCAHAIHDVEIFEIADALEDERFFDNPLVTADPRIRFYAGAPLIAPDGSALGTLCVIDREPRQLNELQRSALGILAKQVVNQLELRRAVRQVQDDAEKIRELNATKDKFFSIISHDLKSPLNAMQGLSELLAQKLDPVAQPEAKEMAQSVAAASASLIKLVGNLLAWAMAQSNQTEFNPVPLDLAPLIREVVKELGNVADGKSIRTVCDEVASAWVFGDEHMLRSILRNLVGNAIKFTEPGGSVTVSLVADGDSVDLSVSDTGEGMGERKMRSLFKIGEMQSTVGTAGERGTGLGLLLVKEFLEKHEGTVSVESTVGDGTTFHLQFPRSEEAFPKV